MNSSQKRNIAIELYHSDSRVFTLPDIAMLTGETHFGRLNQRINYQVRQGNLLNPRKGIYAIPGFTPEELGCRIYTPSYVSLERVLQEAGIIFQYDTRITVVSYLSRELTIGTYKFTYRKVKNEILIDPRGILRQGPISKAIPERAYLDLNYLNGEMYIDNFQALDPNKLKELLPLYRSTALSKRTQKLLEKHGHQ